MTVRVARRLFVFLAMCLTIGAVCALVTGGAWQLAAGLFLAAFLALLADRTQEAGE